MLHKKACPELDQPETWAQEAAAWTIEQARAIQQIPAPTFAEAGRAVYVASEFRALGLEQVDSDRLHNVYGCRPGIDTKAPALLVTAHTDTIFDAETDLAQRLEGDAVYGPGLGDNSMGVAGLLALARWLTVQPTPRVTVWFAATSREEGLGDLGGMKAVFARLGATTGAVLNLEGLALGHIYHGGIAVRRLKVSASAGGGHSWLHYGRPSALHRLIDLGAALLELIPPVAPRTTFNIGLIEGGDAINAIASQAAFWLDLRSETSTALQRFEERVRAAITEASDEDARFAIEVVGDRPAGQIAVDHPLVHIGVTALAAVGIKAALETGSTDANVPLAAGCPAITLGVTRGGNAHRIDEYVELGPVLPGIQQLVLALRGALEYLAPVR
ncbi:MAG TPA: M20/M25/M40 family metallo-hydrolase [Candidatus Limnocylindrales bacterium]|nr:M20/M25/M40 family metallo-hydrolase [Candidatus Limnocylindrales bacterium]